MAEVFRILVLCLIMLTVRHHAFADAAGYTGKTTVAIADARYSVVHYHDWSQRGALWEITKLPRRESVRIFDGKHNNFSYIKIFDKATGTLQLRLPCPALSVLWLSPDSRYLIGLSDVMVWNPYQLVVYELPSGKRVYAEPIETEVFLFSPSEYADLIRRFPEIKTVVDQRSRTFESTGDRIVINAIFGLLNELPNKKHNAIWDALYPHLTAHPYSSNFDSSVTNWVFWYDEKDPGITLIEEGEVLVLSLNDPKHKRFSVRIPLDSTLAK